MVFRQFEVDSDCFTPRTYQSELVDKAKLRNIIVPLGTGTGKTYIAVLLIRELADEIRKPLSEGGKRTFFLVDKVSLVAQQAAQIRRVNDFNVAELCGRKHDLWTNEVWERTLEENQVCVMTAQIFLDLLNHGRWSLERTSLIVFDECHHALGDNHPYRQILRDHYRPCREDAKPKILGLTASVINERIPPKMLESKMTELEKAMCCAIETTSDLVNLSIYGAKPKIIAVLCHDYRKDEGVALKMKLLLKGVQNFVKSTDFHEDFDLIPTKPCDESFQKCLAILDQLGLWCAWKVLSIKEKQMAKVAKACRVTEEQESFNLLGLTYLRTARQVLEPLCRPVCRVEDLVNVCPNKIIRLLDILRHYKPKRIDPTVASCAQATDVITVNGKKNDVNEFSGIIFVEQRQVAFMLKVLLKNIVRWDPENYGFLKVDYAIGVSGNNPTEQEQQSLHRRLEEVMRNFRQKHLNLLVATSVLEEGVDVRQCNCVIRFDPPANFRSFVQSKGRARKAGSKFFVLVEESNADSLQAELKDYFNMEATLIRHCHARGNPPGETVDLSLADQIIPGYFPEVKDVTIAGAKPRVTASNAVALVNRYCARLPSDIFTRLTPQSSIEEVKRAGNTYFTASVILPINSPVKQVIKCEPMPTRKLAQLAVAVEVCKTLHQQGELNDYLLPVGKEALKFDFDDYDDEIWPTDGSARPGSTKRRRYYDKKLAEVFHNSGPTVGKTVWIHVIEMKLMQPANARINPKGRKTIDPEDCTWAFGIMGTVKMPSLPQFPIYTRQGELSVKVYSEQQVNVTSAEEMETLAQFHRYLFSDILRLEKFSMIFDLERAPCSCFVVPMRKEREGDNIRFQLDWEFMKKIVGSLTQMPKIPTTDERRNYKFVREKFEDAVVMPWYRNRDHPHYYYVADILDSWKPSSNFPDKSYDTFNDYFREKYGMKILNQDQPLMDVDYTSSRLNLLTPRLVNRRGMLVAGVSEPKVISMTQKQILVPELVDIHPIPGSMWNMIVCLPSVLYRVNHLLLADELRIRIQEEAFGRPGHLPTDFKFDPLDYGWSKNFENVPDNILLDDSIDFDDDESTKYCVAEGDEYDKLEVQLGGTKDKSAGAVPKRFGGKSGGGRDDKSFSSKGSASKDATSSSGADDFVISVWDPLEAENITLEPNVILGLPLEAIAPPIQLIGTGLGPNGPNLSGLNNFTMSPQELEAFERSFLVPPTVPTVPLEDVTFKTLEDAAVLMEEERKKLEREAAVDEDESAEALDEEEELIYLSTDFSKHIMRLQERKAQADRMSSDLAASGESPVDVIDLFAPNPNIEPTGWDAPIVHTAKHLNGLNITPNSIYAPTMQFDVTQPISNHYVADVMDLPIDSDGEIGESLLLPSNFESLEPCASGYDPLTLVGWDEINEEEQRRSLSRRKAKELTKIRDLKRQKLMGIEPEEYTPDSAIEEFDPLKLLGEPRHESPYVPSHEITENDYDFVLDTEMGSDDIDKGKEEEVLGERDWCPQEDVQPWLIDIESPPLKRAETFNRTIYVCSGNGSSASVELSEISDGPVLPTEEENNEESIILPEVTPVRSTITIDDDVFRPTPSSSHVYEEIPAISFDQNVPFDTPSLQFGPSPCLLLQALTMSNANDAINLERLETVGDSFLKYSITAYLFCLHPDKHEGKLSFLRSKQVSNFRLYRLGLKKNLGELMVAAKFEPSDNWLPFGYLPVEEKFSNEGAEEADLEMDKELLADDTAISSLKLTEEPSHDGFVEVVPKSKQREWLPEELAALAVPFNLLIQQSIPDKSIADCVEALIGVYLLTYGPKGALKFMTWLGLKVECEELHPREPLLNFVLDPMADLRSMWLKHNFGHFEATIGYVFRDKAYCLQAFTHASYHCNRITECYQRLEFLGDAVLDYMITRHLYEDKRKHTPGVLTDLRSALVNNTIFASLAVKFELHKYFLAICPGLYRVIENFVKIQNERKDDEVNFHEEFYLLGEEDCEDEEDIEVPKALGDMFESVAGAIYLDSGGSLDAVWKVYYRMMKDQIEKCCANPPKSPVRELLELEPETAKFSRLERNVIEGKVRVTVDVFGKGRFVGMGRNYRIAKCTAAKRALKHLRSLKNGPTQPVVMTELDGSLL